MKLIYKPRLHGVWGIKTASNSRISTETEHTEYIVISFPQIRGACPPSGKGEKVLGASLGREEYNVQFMESISVTHSYCSGSCISTNTFSPELQTIQGTDNSWWRISCNPTASLHIKPLGIYPCFFLVFSEQLPTPMELIISSMLLPGWTRSAILGAHLTKHAYIPETLPLQTEKEMYEHRDSKHSRHY